MSYNSKNFDLCIVLGGGIDKNTQQLNQITKKRFDLAYKFKDYYKYLICTGDKTYKKDLIIGVEITEAKAGFNYISSKNKFKNKIYLEEKSKDTFSNFYFSRVLIEKENLGKNILIITSNFHLNKAKFLAEFVFSQYYNLVFLPADLPENIDQDLLKKREISEKEVLNFYQTHLIDIYKLKKADLSSIAVFMEKINPAMTGVKDIYHDNLTKKVKNKIGLLYSII